MPVVTVKVSSFMKHPTAGHTLYECRVELPHTRQVRSCITQVPRCRLLSVQRTAGRAHSSVVYSIAFVAAFIIQH